MTRARIFSIGGLIALIVVAFIGFASIYVVDPTKSALVLRFGQPINVALEPGIYFKVPLIDNVVYIEKRLLDLDSPLLEIIAEDQKRLVVNAFARYRVVDPLRFYTTVGNVNVANSRLSDIMNSAVRRVLGEATFLEVVAQIREELMAQITERVNIEGAGFGVEVVDVRIRRADLPDANSQAIYSRMQTERQQEAAQIRGEGEELARTIRAQADRTVTVTVALSNQQAEIIRGDGDEQANLIFADAYGRDPAFFAFYRSMLAYQQALGGGTTTMLLSPNSDFFRFFNQFGLLDTAAPTIAPGTLPIGDTRPGIELPPPLVLPPPIEAPAPVVPAPAPVTPAPANGGAAPAVEGVPLGP